LIFVPFFVKYEGVAGQWVFWAITHALINHYPKEFRSRSIYGLDTLHTAPSPNQQHQGSDTYWFINW